MPFHTGFAGSYKHEADVFRTLKAYGEPRLHAWPSLNYPDCNEIDLFLVDTSSGLFAIEIKSHSIDRIRSFSQNEWVLDDESPTRGPIEQADRAAKQLATALRKGDFVPPWITSAVLWSNIDRDRWEQRFALNPKIVSLSEGMLFRDDLNSGVAIFREALKRVSRTPCRNKGREPEHVPNVTLDALVRMLADDRAPVLDDADRQRLAYLESRQAMQSIADVPVDSGTRLLMTGPPGTGKTWALLSIARHHAEAGRRVLFLCYNHVLHGDLVRIGRSIQSPALREYVDFETIFGFYQSWVTSRTIGPGFEESTAADWINDMSLALSATDDPPRYDLILVDEAQDMLPALEPILDRCLAPGGSIAVAVGPGQSLYSVAPEWLERFERTARHVAFLDIYRTPAAAFCVAQAIRESAIDVGLMTTRIDAIVAGQCTTPFPWQVDFKHPGSATPALHYLRPPRGVVDLSENHWSKELGHVVDEARKRLSAKERPSDILFLLPSSRSVLRGPLMEAIRSRNLAVADLIHDKQRPPDPGEIRVSTYHSARGVEASVVILLDLGRLLEATTDNETLANLVFIALTRSLRDTIVVEELGNRSRIGEMIEKTGTAIKAQFQRHRERFRPLILENLPEGYLDTDR